MIASLRGKLLSLSGSEIVIDVQGVGYAVTVTSHVLAKLPAPGEELYLLIYTDVRETSISLFGFANLLEKHVFLLLQKVKGIGSRTALGILSGIGAEKLLSHIGHRDISALKTVPGVGKKTAERLIIELREHVGDFIEVPVALGSGGSRSKADDSFSGSASGDGIDLLPKDSTELAVLDATLALEKLGFARDKAESAVKEASRLWLASEADAKLEAGELLRRSLAVL